MTETKIKVELIVDGKTIKLNEFVHKIVGNVLEAILKSLRLDHQPKSVTFNVKF